MHFLNSNIWNISFYNELLFNKLELIADEELVNQKNMIWICVKNAEKKERKIWNKICLFNIEMNGSKRKLLRQDTIGSHFKMLNIVILNLMLSI